MSGTHKIVLVCDPENGYTIYRDGTVARAISTQDLGDYGYVHFGNLAGANAIYIGGIVTADNPNKYPFNGTFKSVRFWNEALTQQVQMLNWNNLDEVQGLDKTWQDDNNAPIEYYNLQGIRVINPGNGIYIMRQGDKVTKIHLRNN